MSDDITQAIRTSLLPHKLSDQSLQNGLLAIDSLIEAGESDRRGLLTSPAFLQQAKCAARELLHEGYQCAKASVLIPTGLFGLTQGLVFPDRDIKLPGIGQVFLLP